MNKRGYTDLPLHYGHVPAWLAERMRKLGGLIIESVAYNFGKQEVIKRLSDPFWFQALGCVLGMDWHSSGITTSVLRALKKAINPRAKELGIYICGGRGKYSRQTPYEIMNISEKTGLDGDHLVKCSKLSAKIDNTAIQDGFNLYLHAFIMTNEGDWAVIQQGMNTGNKMARRYHWYSKELTSFVEEPHTAVVGEHMGLILNLTDKDAGKTREGILSIVEEKPSIMIPEIKKVLMPRHHDVRANDVNLRRLAAVLAAAHESSLNNFSSLLLVNGLGPRTMQSLTLVSEVIFGTQSRFNDPARFSFAHGGKDGHPFPVPLKVYDQSIAVLKEAVTKAKIGHTDRMKSLKRLHDIAKVIENNNNPEVDYNALINKERNESHKYGGRTVFQDTKMQPFQKIGGNKKSNDTQLYLPFD